MLLCESEDLKLAALIIDAYNYSARDEIDATELADKIEAMEQKVFELYCSDEEPEPNMIEVPVELFHRMAAEVEHHKAMLGGRGAGVVATIGASTSTGAEYGIAKDIEIAFRVKIRAPEGQELTDEEIDKIIDCAVDGFRATLVREGNALKDEVKEVQSRVNELAN